MNRCSKCKKLLMNEYEFRRHRCHQEDDTLPVHQTSTFLDSFSYPVPSYEGSSTADTSSWDSGGGDSGGGGASGDW